MTGERERILSGTETGPDQVTRILEGVRAARVRSVERPYKTAAKASLFGGQFTGSQMHQVNLPYISLIMSAIACVRYRRLGSAPDNKCDDGGHMACCS
jgi:hypothetical protein